MSGYSGKITLIKNERGCYCLDSIVGCSKGIENQPKGCYDDCYAAKYSKRYGYDFSESRLRFFESEQHKRSIIKRINRIGMPFIRIGASGVNVCIFLVSDLWNYKMESE